MQGYLYIGGAQALPTSVVNNGGSTPVINELNITPSTSAQTFNSSSVDGYKPINVAAVTNQIDVNITQENIKKDVQILGVTGVLEEAPISQWYLWKNGQDSITLTPDTTSLTQSGYKAITFGDNQYFMLVGNGVSAYGAIPSSSSAFSWTESTMTNNYNSVTYGNNYYIAVGSQVFAYKNHTNMSNAWTESSLSGYYNSVIFGLGRFVAVGVNGFAYSFAGYPNTSWTEGTLTNIYEDVTCGDNKFVAIGYGCYAYSLDGANWTEGVLTGTNYSKITYGNGKFVAVGSRDFAYSLDGITWVESHFNPIDDEYETSFDARSITFGDGIFVVIGDKCYAYSDDGIHWTEDFLTSTYKDIAYGSKYNTFMGITGNSLILGTVTKSDKCYTSTLNPTISSIVYSYPQTPSALTITAVEDDTITLSDTKIYNKTGKFVCTSFSINREVSVDGIYQMPSYEFTFTLPSTAKDVAFRSLYQAFYQNGGIVKVDLSSLVNLTRAQAFYQAFYQCTNLEEVDLKNLVAITNDIDTVTAQTLYQTFYQCPKLTTVDFSNLQIVSGGAALGGTFNTTPIETISFPSLRFILGTSVFNGCFSNCKKLKDVYFNALTTMSFGSSTSQFQGMFNALTGSESSTGYCTVHFPSNLQSVVSGLSGYSTNFGGGSSGYVTLVFDLPATS